MKVTVNAMGDTCPIPVVKTRNAIKELSESGEIEVLVDNEIAVQNLTKMAQQKGYEIHSEKIADGQFKANIKVEISEGAKQSPAGSVVADVAQIDKATGDAAEEQCLVQPSNDAKNTVVVISSSTMGSGDDELGTILIKGFIYAISQQETLPKTMLFYNGGAKLTCEEAPTLEDIKSLEAQGVEILTCGTCLNHYGLSEKLKVGSVTNMYDIAEKMTQADLIVKP